MTKKSIAHGTGDRQGYFYIIPAPLAEGGDKTKALLYGVISSLANRDGYCFASNPYLAEKLGMKSRSRISETINELEAEGWIRTEIANNNSRKVWLSELLPATYTRKRTPLSEKTDTPLSEKADNSNKSLSIKSEDNLATAKADAGKEVNELIKVFYDAGNVTANFGNKTQRQAAEDLIKKIGHEQAIKAAQYAVRIQGEKYAPTITTPYQLREKFAQLATHAKKNNRPRVADIS